MLNCSFPPFIRLLFICFVPFFSFSFFQSFSLSLLYALFLVQLPASLFRSLIVSSFFPFFLASEMGLKKRAFKQIWCRRRGEDHFLSSKPLSDQNFTVIFGVINMAKFANAPPQIGPQLHHTAGYRDSKTPLPCGLR